MITLATNAFLILIDSPNFSTETLLTFSHNLLNVSDDMALKSESQLTRTVAGTISSKKFEN